MVIGAVLIEYVREIGHTSRDVALAILFYGGIAGGVVIIQLAGGTSQNLMGYLFGSLSTVTASDLIIAVVLAVVVGIGSTLFSEFTQGFQAQPTIEDAMALVLAARPAKASG